MSFKSYKEYKDVVGEKGLKIESMNVRKQVLDDELDLTKEFYKTKKYIFGSMLVYHPYDCNIYYKT